MNLLRLSFVASLLVFAGCQNCGTSGTDAGACAQGSTGCPCYGNGTCDANLSCSASNVCDSCPTRSEGCACATGACNSGLVCMANKCVTSGARLKSALMLSRYFLLRRWLRSAEAGAGKVPRGSLNSSIDSQ